MASLAASRAAEPGPIIPSRLDLARDPPAQDVVAESELSLSSSISVPLTPSAAPSSGQESNIAKLRDGVVAFDEGSSASEEVDYEGSSPDDEVRPTCPRFSEAAPVVPRVARTRTRWASVSVPYPFTPVLKASQQAADT